MKRTVLSGLLLGLIIGIGESLVIIGLGDISFSMRAALQLLIFAGLVYGLLSGVAGLVFALLWRWWPTPKRDVALSFAWCYLGFGLFFFVAFRWSLVVLEQGDSLMSPLNLLVTGLLFILCLALSYFLVPVLARVWLALHRKNPWLNGRTGLGVFVGVIALFLWFNTRGVGAQVQSLPSPAAEASKPNVVVIVIDTTRVDRYEIAQTPNLDEWARRGAVFKEAMVQMPLTGPSHATLFTAKYPRSHGVLSNGWVLPDRELTLAEILAQQGYTTAAFVSAFVLNANVSGMHQGFQTYDDNLAPFGRQASLTIMRITNYLIGGTLKERRADATTRSVLDWVEQGARQPFFLWVHYFDPHSPYDPPAPYDRLYEPAGDSEVAQMLALYDGEITFADAQAGHLLAKLEAEGLMDNTILVITADHGESFGEHHNYFGHGEYLYEPSTKVPLIFFYPPLIEAGTIIQSQVQLLDVTPTILELLDISPKQEMQGSSLLPLLSEADPSRPAFSQVFPGEGSLERYSVKRQGWKYIYTPEEEGVELYNLKDDPQELRNLADADAGMTQQMADRLTEWLEVTPLVFEEQTIDAETQELLKELGY